MQNKQKRDLLKNILDSGISDIWFNIVTNSLITSAFIYLVFAGYQSALPLALICYFFLILKTIHGTRESYEYLKNIYVYSNDNNFTSIGFNALFWYVRIQIFIAPIEIIILAYSQGKLPI